MVAAMHTVPEDIKEETIFERAVPISKMFVHYRTEPGGYARPANENRLRKLVDEFEPQAVGILLLSLREDGLYAIIDGQHRMEAAKRSGMTALDAYVYIDLTLEEEAHLYRKFGDYLKQTALDKYKAAIAEQQPEALALDRILGEVGLHVSSSGGPEARSVTAVGTIEKIAREMGPQILRDSLKLIRDAYDFEIRAFTNQVIWGTAQFLVRFGKHPRFNRARLVDRLRTEGLTGLIAKGNAVRALDRSEKTPIGRALVTIHDAGLQEKNRLGVWPAMVMRPASIAAARERMAGIVIPASIQARKIKAADNAKAIAKCPQCRVEPGADCKNVKGHSLGNTIHNERYIEARRMRHRRDYGNGK